MLRMWEKSTGRDNLFCQGELFYSFFSFSPPGSAKAERPRASLTGFVGSFPRMFINNTSFILPSALAAPRISLLSIVTQIFPPPAASLGAGELQLTHLSRVQVPWGLRYSGVKGLAHRSLPSWVRQEVGRSEAAVLSIYVTQKADSALLPAKVSKLCSGQFGCVGVFWTSRNVGQEPRPSPVGPHGAWGVSVPTRSARDLLDLFFHPNLPPFLL